MSTLSKPRKALPIAVLLIIVIHVCAVAVLDMENSPNIDECAHLVSGLHHWEFGQYDLYRVNPPLIRSLASLSCYLCQAGIGAIHPFVASQTLAWYALIAGVSSAFDMRKLTVSAISLLRD